MSVSTVKSENLSCRISPEHKRLIEQAAMVSGFSTSEFILHALVSAASEVVREESVIRLSKADWDTVMAALERPAREPGEAMKRAVERYNAEFGANDQQGW
jgi:uncharacterized protein (DUF1778 family)